MNLIKSPESSAMGQLGVDLITDTSSHTGSWAIITALSATVFATLTTDRAAVNGAADAATALNGLSLAAGSSIYGLFTVIDLTSGSVLAYRG